MAIHEPSILNPSGFITKIHHFHIQDGIFGFGFSLFLELDWTACAIAWTSRDGDDDGDDGDAIQKGDDGFVFFIVVVVDRGNAWWDDNDDANHECDDSEGARQKFNDDDDLRSGRTMERTRIDDGRHADARVVVDDGAHGGGRRVDVQRWW
jgi:hypothetical protein